MDMHRKSRFRMHGIQCRESGCKALTQPVCLLLPQYMCVGLSVYDEARLRAAGAESRSSPLAPVEIPYCEGLEIVSAANVQESPALLGADAGAGEDHACV